MGDIEELPDHRKCIVCPWHRYKIDIVSGEGLYYNLEHQLCTKGVKQRAHSTRLSDVDNVPAVFVKLNLTEDAISSDGYAYFTVKKSGQ